MEILDEIKHILRPEAQTDTQSSSDETAPDTKRPRRPFRLRLPIPKQQFYLGTGKFLDN